MPGNIGGGRTGLLDRFARGWAMLLSVALVTALLGSAPATASAPAAQAPVADAGADLTTVVGQTVTLDGTGSTDPDGDDLTYSWTLAGAQPGDYTQSMDDPTSATPSFTPALVGTYTATLVVSDGTRESLADTVAITVGDGIEVTWQCDGVTVTAPVRISRVVVAQGDERSRHTGRASTWTLKDTPGITSIWVSVRGNDSGEGLGLGTRFDRPDQEPCEPANEAPVADAGTDQAATVGGTVTLDGTGSTDPDGDDLTYAWVLTSPDGSAAALDDPAAAQPSFSPDVAGDYTAELTVNDGTDDSPADGVTVTVSHRPVAEARIDSVNGSLVQLDGSGSSDGDGDQLTYAWTLTAPEGSAATLDDASAVAPTFTLDVNGDYTASLVVSDGAYDSAAASVTVSVQTPPNQVPVADAGPDQEGIVGDSITLDGTGSADADDDTLTYAWTLTSPDGSTATLDDPSASQPRLIPDVAGDYTAHLVVNDGTDDSPADSVSITVSEPPNRAPIAQLDLYEDGAIGERVLLVGYYSSDPDGDELSYTWDFQMPDGSTVIPDHPIESTSTFWPDVAGTYLITMVVNDGQTTASQTLTLTIGHRPVADPGPQQTPVTGDTVTLDGTGSTDADGDDLTYEWFLSLPTGSSAALDDLTSATPSFTPDVAGLYRIRLIVHDGRYASSWSWLYMTVTDPVNEAPVADAGPDLGAVLHEPVSLDGTGSNDPDGDLLTYAWTLTGPDGSTATLNDPAAAQPQFTADRSGTYAATLTVADRHGATSAPDVVMITARPKLIIADHTLGMDLQTSTGWMFSGALPDPVDVTVTVSDESIALVSPDYRTIGSKTITIEDITQQLALMDVQLQGLAAGTTTVTVTAPGYPDTTALITVTADRGFAFAAGDFTVGETADPASVYVFLHPLDDSGNRLHRQGLRAGVAPINVPLTNSDDSVGTLTEQYVRFHSGSGQAYTHFDPASAGTTTLSFTQPDGFSEPADGLSRITATVTPPPQISVGDVTVGKDLQTWVAAEFSSAPPFPTDVTVTVGDASIALLATSGDQVGSGTVTITDVTDTTSNFAVQGMAEGSTTMTVSAPGWPDVTGTITVTGSGFAMMMGDVTTTTDAPDVTIYVGLFAHAPDGSTGPQQSLRGGTSVTIKLTNSNDTVGTLTQSQLTMHGGTRARVTTYFDPHSAGQSEVTFTQPDGFTLPSDSRSNLPFTIVEPEILSSDTDCERPTSTLWNRSHV